MYVCIIIQTALQTYILTLIVHLPFSNYCSLVSRRAHEQSKALFTYCLLDLDDASTHLRSTSVVVAIITIVIIAIITNIILI